MIDTLILQLSISQFPNIRCPWGLMYQGLEALQSTPSMHTETIAAMWSIIPKPECFRHFGGGSPDSPYHFTTLLGKKKIIIIIIIIKQPAPEWSRLKKNCPDQFWQQTSHHKHSTLDPAKNIEPENNGLVQMILLFKQMIFRWTNHAFSKKCGENSWLLMMAFLLHLSAETSFSSHSEHFSSCRRRNSGVAVNNARTHWSTNRFFTQPFKGGSTKATWFEGFWTSEQLF